MVRRRVLLEDTRSHSDRLCPGCAADRDLDSRCHGLGAGRRGADLGVDFSRSTWRAVGHSGDRARCGLEVRRSGSTASRVASRPLHQCDRRPVVANRRRCFCVAQCGPADEETVFPATLLLLAPIVVVALALAVLLIYFFVRLWRWLSPSHTASPNGLPPSAWRPPYDPSETDAESSP